VAPARGAQLLIPKILNPARTANLLTRDLAA